MRDTNTVLLDVETYNRMMLERRTSKLKIQELQVDLKNTLLENKKICQELEEFKNNRCMIENT